MLDFSHRQFIRLLHLSNLVSSSLSLIVINFHSRSEFIPLYYAWSFPYAGAGTACHFSLLLRQPKWLAGRAFCLCAQTDSALKCGYLWSSHNNNIYPSLNSCVFHCFCCRQEPQLQYKMSHSQIQCIEDLTTVSQFTEWISISIWCEINFLIAIKEKDTFKCKT